MVFFSENKTDWTQHGTDSQLEYRIKDIEEWKRTLTTTLHNVEAEIDKARVCCCIFVVVVEVLLLLF